MPNASLKEAIKEAYALAPTGVVILNTLEFRHPAFTQPIRCVLDYQNLTATLEADAPVDAGQAVEFVAYAFDMTLPPVDESARPEILIVIDNVSREITDQLDAAAELPDKIELTYRPYLSTDTSAPQMDPPLHLVVTEVDADNARITARGTFGDYSNKRFPAEDYSTARFPGLAR